MNGIFYETQQERSDSIALPSRLYSFTPRTNFSMLFAFDRRSKLSGYLRFTLENFIKNISKLSITNEHVSLTKVTHLHAGSPTVSKNRQVPPFMQKSPVIGHGCSCLTHGGVAVTKVERKTLVFRKDYAHHSFMGVEKVATFIFPSNAIPQLLVSFFILTFLFFSFFFSRE